MNTVTVPNMKIASELQKIMEGKGFKVTLRERRRGVEMRFKQENPFIVTQQNIQFETEAAAVQFADGAVACLAVTNILKSGMFNESEP
jgi:hypothetical protein